MAGSDQRFRPAGGPEGRNGRTAIARSTGSGQRPDAKDDLVGRVKGFVPVGTSSQITL